MVVNLEVLKNFSVQNVYVQLMRVFEVYIWIVLLFIKFLQVVIFMQLSLRIFRLENESLEIYRCRLIILGSGGGGMFKKIYSQ